MPKFYITTSIPYVNAKPHIGHALEFVQTDVMARAARMAGKKVFLTTGADENSLKNVQSAEALGISTAELCARNAKLFRELSDRIGLSYDAFIRSSVKDEHWSGVEEIWKRCNDSGDIYKKRYKGLYCVGCELFYKESELVDGLCPIHHKKVDIVEEENYFFRLSKYQEKLQELIESGKLKILPESKKHEILNFIKEGLEDFSISRSEKRAHGWGVPVPGDSSQIIYVWFDALTIYLSGIGFGKDAKTFDKWWPADVHVIGKDITKFHAIYWPAMLLSAKLDVPKTISVHGFLTIDGQKMSKSLGNVVDPMEMLDKYKADPVRYYLTKEISTFEDGDFSEKTLKDAINNELVGNLGNFVNRTFAFINSKWGGKLEEQELEEGKLLLDEIYKLVDQALALIEEGQLNLAVLKIMEISGMGNRYFQNNEPWKLIKEDEDATKEVLFVCANICRILGILTYPYMPSASEALLAHIGEKPKSFKDAKKLVKSFSIAAPKVLFSKVE